MECRGPSFRFSLSAGSDFSVFIYANKTAIVVVYPTGTYGTTSSTTTTIKTRVCTISGSTLSFAAQVTVIQCGGYLKACFCQSGTGRFWLSTIAYRMNGKADTDYHLVIWYSDALGVWTSSLDEAGYAPPHTVLVDFGYSGIVIIVKTSATLNKIMALTGMYSDAYFCYKTFDGSTWSAITTGLGVKTVNTYQYGMSCVWFWLRSRLGL